MNFFFIFITKQGNLLVYEKLARFVKIWNLFRYIQYMSNTPRFK